MTVIGPQFGDPVPVVVVSGLPEGDRVWEENRGGQRRWLYRVDDDTAFAYERGHDFIRVSDSELWAHASDRWLLSARSGEQLAYQRDGVFFDSTTDTPLYYQSTDM